MKKAIIFAIVLLLILFGAACAEELQEEEKTFSIRVDKTEAVAGETVTWEVNAQNFEKGEIVEYYINITLDCDPDLEYRSPFLEYGPYTLDEGSSVSISKRLTMNGKYTLSVDCDSIYGRLYFDGGTVTVTGSSLVPLSALVTADRETASGDDTVTWTITPSGGTPDYEIIVDLVCDGGYYGEDPYGEVMLKSNGEPVQYSQKILYGQKDQANSYWNWIIHVTITDAEGFSAYGNVVGVTYQNPLYNYAYAEIRSKGDFCLDGEMHFFFTPIGSVGPFTDFVATFYLESIEYPILKELKFPVIQEGETAEGIFVISSDEYQEDVSFRIIESFTDGLGNRWEYAPSSSAHHTVSGVGPNNTSIIPTLSSALIGDELQWNISYKRPYYSSWFDASYIDDEGYELLITPCCVDADGNTAELSDPVLYETHGEVISYNIIPEKEGAYYLKVVVKDVINRNGSSFEGGKVNVSVSEPVTGFTLPAELQMIEAEAFVGINAETVIIPDGCSTIRPRAFADSPMLKEIILPDSVSSIDESAIDKNVTIYGKAGSDILIWAKDHGYHVVEQ